MLWSVYLLGQRQRPSWCLAVMITIRIPASRMTFTHWRASNAVGLKTEGLSVPVPHSRFVKVFVPKWTNAMNSRSCQLICRGEGTTCAAFRMMSPAVVPGAMTATLCAVSMGAFSWPIAVDPSTAMA